MKCAAGSIMRGVLTTRAICNCGDLVTEEQNEVAYKLGLCEECAAQFYVDHPDELRKVVEAADKVHCIDQAFLDLLDVNKLFVKYWK